MMRQKRYSRTPTHDFFDESMAVRQLLNVLESRRAFRSNDFIELSPSGLECFGVKNTGEREGEQGARCRVGATCQRFSEKRNNQ